MVMAFMLAAGGCGGGGDKNDGAAPSPGGKALTVTPSVLHLVPGESALLTADNIRGNLTWMSRSEYVSVYPMNERSATVTAFTLGEVDVLVFDSSGAEAVCRVIVAYEPIPDPTPVTPVTPVIPPEPAPIPTPASILNDEWDISGGPNGDGKAEDASGKACTLQLQDGGKFKLNITDSGTSSASGVHAAAGEILAGTVDIQLTWNVLDASKKVVETFSFAASGTAALEIKADNIYMYTHDNVVLEINVNSNGSLIVTQTGKARGYDYEATYTAKGFLFALSGTWVGSNGHATGIVDGIEGTATLVDGGTVTLSVLQITQNTVAASASVDAEWHLYAGGQYLETEPLSFGTFGTVTIQRLNTKAFRFAYQDAYGQETVDITLTSKTQGQVRQRGNYPADGISYDGSYTITKK
jgi:hypothetical protein